MWGPLLPRLASRRPLRACRNTWETRHGIMRGPSELLLVVIIPGRRGMGSCAAPPSLSRLIRCTKTFLDKQTQCFVPPNLRPTPAERPSRPSTSSPRPPPPRFPSVFVDAPPRTYPPVFAYLFSPPQVLLSFRGFSLSDAQSPLRS